MFEILATLSAADWVKCAIVHFHVTGMCSLVFKFL